MTGSKSHRNQVTDTFVTGLGEGKAEALAEKASALLIT